MHGHCNNICLNISAANTLHPAASCHTMLHWKATSINRHTPSSHKQPHAAQATQVFKDHAYLDRAPSSRLRSFSSATLSAHTMATPVPTAIITLVWYTDLPRRSVDLRHHDARAWCEHGARTVTAW